MLDYDEPLFRPPSEAYSLILQVTLGCSHNGCAFCGMYRNKRFRVRPLEEIFAEIDEVSRHIPSIRRVFLADGDAVVLKTDRLLAILERVYKKFSGLERVTAYANPSNILRKSPEELQQLRAAGLTMVYVGIESGDETILERINKGATAQEIIDSINKAQENGIDVSATVLLGLGGKAESEAHIAGTVEVVNACAPRYTSALTLILLEGPHEEMFLEASPGWELPPVPDLLREVRGLVAGIEAQTTFRANHASNYLTIKAELPQDRDKTLAYIDRALQDPSGKMLRPEWSRAL